MGAGRVFRMIEPLVYFVGIHGRPRVNGLIKIGYDCLPDAPARRRQHVAQSQVGDRELANVHGQWYDVIAPQ